ncbi:hypothetical protein ABT263_38440 [Kitasatospora sp. NPDC001603]|uniref:hypothetical protein n=1 Tax=Kitasatospora sp. NPDC001603 TaxID=3154388 RepID=UPI00332CED10
MAYLVEPPVGTADGRSDIVKVEIEFAEPSMPTLIGSGALGSVQTLQDVEGIEFAENGRLMTVCNSTALELWDVRDPTAPVLTAPVADPSGGSIRAGALVAAGPTLLVASNQRVSLLDTDPANLAARLCSYSTGAISRSQWEKYVPEVAYRGPCSGR